MMMKYIYMISLTVEKRLWIDPHGQQFQSEIKIVNQVLHSNDLNYWTGKNCTNFEKDFSKTIQYQIFYFIGK